MAKGKARALLRRVFTARHLMAATFILFIACIIYIVVRIVLAPSMEPESGEDVRVKGDYVLMLSQCVLGALAMLLPGYLRRNMRIRVPNTMMTLYALFLFCSIYLGEVHFFYYSVPHWDTMLHVFSGAALGALGFSLVTLMNRSEAVTFSLSPIFVAAFAFCFALALGALWEIYEFSCDAVLGTNMQKHTLETGEGLIGHAAVADTMKDFIVDALSALAVSVLGFLSLKYQKGWLERFRLRRGSAA